MLTVTVSLFWPGCCQAYHKFHFPPPFPCSFHSSCVIWEGILFPILLVLCCKKFIFPKTDASVKPPTLLPPCTFTCTTGNPGSVSRAEYLAAYSLSGSLFLLNPLECNFSAQEQYFFFSVLFKILTFSNSREYVWPHYFSVRLSCVVSFSMLSTTRRSPAWLPCSRPLCSLQWVMVSVDLLMALLRRDC